MKKKLLPACCLMFALWILCSCNNTGGKESPSPNGNAPAPSSAGVSGATDSSNDIWPTGDITMYVPNDAGSPLDIAVRVCTNYLQKATGVTVIVENNSVGDGEILMQKLHSAKPDGQTLMYTGVGAILQHYNGVHEYNPADPNDYTIVCSALSTYAGGVFYTRADAPYSTVDELVEYAKTHPGEVRVSLLSGTTGEIESTKFFKAIGIWDDIRIVEASVAEVAVGLMGGTIDVSLFLESFLFEDSLKPLICNRLDRDYDKSVDPELAQLLDKVPIFGETGLEDCYFLVPMFIIGPPGMSNELCASITEILNGINDDPEATERINALPADMYIPYTTQEMRDMVIGADKAIAEILG